jgi:hypothetical protein
MVPAPVARVPTALGNLAPMRRRLLLTSGLLLPVLVFLLNYSLFQQPIDRVIERDDRNAGMVVRAHWRWFVDPTVLVYDLRETGAGAKGIDVLRALFQFAYRQKDHRFERVVLAWQGTPRFYLTGTDFADLGRQYPNRSPVDAMVVIPPMIRRLDGARAFPGNRVAPFFDEQQQRLLDFNRFVNEWVRR